MKKRNKTLSLLPYFIMVMVLIIVVSADTMYYGTSDPEKWCERNKPALNLSLHDLDIAYCYGEGWDNYCKISYPEYCPDNTYTDYERCLKKCNLYGGECPCDELYG